MKLFRRNDRNANDKPEIILNLWYVFGDLGICYSLRIRAYIATGTEEEKLTFLHRLSAHDWHLAEEHPVPETFRPMLPSGNRAVGFPLAFKAGVGGLMPLFEPAIQHIQESLPGDCGLTIPKDPLTCLTPLYLHDDGTLEPKVLPRQ